MILVMSAIITLSAALEWIIIRRFRWRILRILVQIPLLIITFFGAWFLSLYWESTEQNTVVTDVEILESTTVVIGDVIQDVSATGAITPNRQAILTFPIASSPITQIYVALGDRVSASTVIAEVDGVDFQQALQDSEIAVALQQTRYNLLTQAARPEDITAAQAQLNAAQAQLYAAYASGNSAQDREIARLQAEIARNRLWQTQLSRDGIQPPIPQTLDASFIPAIPAAVPTPFGTNLQEGVDQVIGQINGLLAIQNSADQFAYTSQLSQANSVVTQAGFGVEIADANYESALARGADPGIVASANAARIQAQVALDQVLNGATPLQEQQAQLDLNLAELTMQQAQISLDQTRLSAPFAGIIAQLNLTIGELPPQGIAVLLVDDSSFYVDLPIDETEIAQVKVGQRVIFDVDALREQTITGQVESIAYAPLGVDGVVAYNVRVRLDSTTANLRSGMTVTGRIILNERLGVITIRNNFIRINRLNGDAFVTVQLPDGSFEERLILLGERSETVSEIASGLEVGEVVVLLPRIESLFGD